MPDHAEPKEVYVLCPLWDIFGSCCVQARNDGGPYQDLCDSQFGGPKKCSVVVCNTWAYKILQKVHKGLCSYYLAQREIVEEGCYILLG